jgi:hypothetical protein
MVSLFDVNGSFHPVPQQIWEILTGFLQFFSRSSSCFGRPVPNFEHEDEGRARARGVGASRPAKAAAKMPQAVTG